MTAKHFHNSRKGIVGNNGRKVGWDQSVGGLTDYPEFELYHADHKTQRKCVNKGRIRISCEEF